jgi:hypothetical protein
MDPRQKARLQEFFNRLVDRPLEPDDPFYEPFVGAALGRTAMYVNNVPEVEENFCPYPPEAYKHCRCRLA